MKYDGGRVNSLHFLQPPEEALLLYQRDIDLEQQLFGYVKSGLDCGNAVIYWGGTRAAPEVEQALFSYDIDVDYRKKKGDLTVVTYDDMFLVDGQLDVYRAYARLVDMVRKVAGKNRQIRLATESNWWILADVFEGALVMEEKHRLLPGNMSVVCSYNIDDLLEYVRIYDIAKLIELHRQTVLTTKVILASKNELCSILKRLVLSSMEDLELRSRFGVNTDSNSITRIMQEIEKENKDDVAELETMVEAQFRNALRL